MRTATCLVIILLSSLNGCATLTQDGMQTVMLEAYTKDNQPVQARCVAKNDVGTWVGYAPGRLQIHRSSGDLKILCERERGDNEAGHFTSTSHANDATRGNLIMPGGAIGALIDHATGYGYNYPITMRVVMGDDQPRLYETKKTLGNESSDAIPLTTASNTPLHP
ncbi:hypothetical protein LG204_04380 [Methylovorus menthalis]|uniref:hypothetical protein n=1 Tax=Methylovorus menthalis TaxID=1002227 RepID=UPI001E5C0937|nr:hypothetical protein [Methylovorus menthalis]MCB4810552.1 hypothetical protein [Methylovorus menthalis]